jgi:hypothetical protein
MPRLWPILLGLFAAYALTRAAAALGLSSAILTAALMALVVALIYVGAVRPSGRRAEGPHSSGLRRRRPSR